MAAICASLSRSMNGGIAPPSVRHHLYDERLVRFRVIQVQPHGAARAHIPERVARAAAGTGEERLAVGAAGSRLGARLRSRHARDTGHVRRDVVRRLALVLDAVFSAALIGALREVSSMPGIPGTPVEGSSIGY